MLPNLQSLLRCGRRYCEVPEEEGKEHTKEERGGCKQVSSEERVEQEEEDMIVLFCMLPLYGLV